MAWLTQSVAIITGAGAGIGKAVTERFVAEGAKVVAFDLSESRLNALEEKLGEAIETICGDVRSPADNRAAVRLALSRFGKLDVFVANAGIQDGRRGLGGLSDDALEQGFKEVFAVNVKGYLLGARAARDALKRSRGSLVLTLSTSSFYAGSGPIYTASKHAALGLMRALAHEFAPEVRVNGVAPSGTPTSLADAAALARARPPGAPAVGSPGTNLLNVQITAEDHVGAYLLLASDQSRAMTGAVINSDGGRGVMAANVGRSTT